MSINTQYKDSMLTTLDNPFSPFVNFDEWNAFDISKGYHTSAYLARVSNAPQDLSDDEEALAISDAISEILKYNVTGNYIAVTLEDWSDRRQSIPDSNL